MKKIFNEKSVIIMFNDGTVLSKTNITKKLRKKLKKAKDRVSVEKLIYPNKEFIDKQNKINSLRKDFIKDNKSNYLTKENEYFYIPSIAPNISLPQILVDAIIDAEIKLSLDNTNNEDELLSLLNFWNYACRNPNARARQDLFWFLNRNGMTITKSGLFTGYRNVISLSEDNKIVEQARNKVISLIRNGKNLNIVDKYNIYKIGNKIKISKKSRTKLIKKGYDYLGSLKEFNNSSTTNKQYTDAYTRTFDIKLGEKVEMLRKDCDSNPRKTCSSGLHLASKDWINAGAFGNTTIRVLVNPMDVVAVPTDDNYGKMRVCRYYVDAVLSRDEEGNIIDETENGRADTFVDMIEEDYNKISEIDNKQKYVQKPTETLEKVILDLDQIRQNLNKLYED